MTDYKIIVDSINNIFLNTDNDINKFILNEYKIKTRKSKLTFKDVFLYSLEYTQNHNTKIDIVNQFNISNNTNISRTSF